MWGVSWLRAGLGQSLWDSSARLYAASSPPAARVGLLERQWQGCERKQKHARVIESWAQNWHKVTSSARVHAQLLSRVRLSVTPWTVACQAPLSTGFSRQECWSGLLFLSPGDLPGTGIEPRSPTLQADSLPFEPLGAPVLNLLTVKWWIRQTKGSTGGGSSVVKNPPTMQEMWV